MLRITHCLDSQLTGGGKVVSRMHQLFFTPHKHYYFSVSGTHFCTYVCVHACVYIFSSLQFEFKTTTFISIHVPGEDLNVPYLKG
jgi:hypothetical protein